MKARGTRGLSPGTGRQAVVQLFFLYTGYPRVLPGLTILISPMLSHPGPDKNHVNLIRWLYRKSRINVVK